MPTFGTTQGAGGYRAEGVEEEPVASAEPAGEKPGNSEEVAVDVYLMQHGVALSEEEDRARPLSEAGRAEVERVAARAAEAGVRIDRCLHSGKVRAEQTAQVLASALGVPSVMQRDGLNPSDDVSPFARWLADSRDGSSVAVVGHLPFLDRLASLLVAGDEDAEVVRFRNAGLVKLVPKRDAEGYSLGWALVPEIA